MNEYCVFSRNEKYLKCTEFVLKICREYNIDLNN